jgi:hypothetical protein
VVDRELQKHDQMANCSKAEDDQEKIRADLPGKIPALAVN